MSFKDHCVEFIARHGLTPLTVSVLELESLKFPKTRVEGLAFLSDITKLKLPVCEPGVNGMLATALSTDTAQRPLTDTDFTKLLLDLSTGRSRAHVSAQDIKPLDGRYEPLAQLLTRVNALAESGVPEHVQSAQRILGKLARTAEYDFEFRKVMLGQFVAGEYAQQMFPALSTKAHSETLSDLRESALRTIHNPKLPEDLRRTATLSLKHLYGFKPSGAVRHSLTPTESVSVARQLVELAGKERDLFIKRSLLDEACEHLKSCTVELRKSWVQGTNEFKGLNLRSVINSIEQVARESKAADTGSGTSLDKENARISSTAGNCAYWGRQAQMYGYAASYPRVFGFAVKAYELFQNLRDQALGYA